MAKLSKNPAKKWLYTESIIGRYRSKTLEKTPVILYRYKPGVNKWRSGSIVHECVLHPNVPMHFTTIYSYQTVVCCPICSQCTCSQCKKNRSRKKKSKVHRAKHNF